MCTVVDLPTSILAPLFAALMFTGFHNQFPLLTMRGQRRRNSFDKNRSLLRHQLEISIKLPWERQTMIIRTPFGIWCIYLKTNSVNPIFFREITLAFEKKTIIIVKNFYEASFFCKCKNLDLKWDKHVKEPSKSCYSTLSILRKIKKFADFCWHGFLQPTLSYTNHMA